MDLIEKIIHREELKFLRKLTSGESINLTSQERKLILDALIHPGYVEKISDSSITPYLVRQAYKRVKEKIAIVESFHERKKNEGSG